MLSNRVMLIAAILPMITHLMGCTESSGTSNGEWTGVVRDSAGVQLVENPAMPLWGAEEAWRIEERVSIGQLDGPAEYAFNQISELEVGDSGEVFVLDGGDKVIRVYSPEGQFLRQFGGDGEGPGEFRAPSQLVRHADTLIVYDWRQQRITRLGLHGDVIRTDRTEMTTFEHGFPERLSILARQYFAMVTGTGCALPRRPGDNMWKLFVVTAEAAVQDTLMILERRDQLAIYGEEPNMFCTSIPAPFGRSPSLAMGDSQVVAFGDGDRYEIALYRLDHVSDEDSSGWSLGDPFRLIRRQAASLPTTEEEVEAYKMRFSGGERTPEYMRNRTREVLDALDYPTTWPAYQELRFDPDGNLWVKRPSREADEHAAWDIFDRQGRYLGEVALPARLRVEAMTVDHIYGVVRDELDVQYVKGYRILRPASNETDS